MRINDTPGYWDNCDHTWVGVDSMSYHSVRCVKCECPGEENPDTGEVDWPTT